MRWSLQLHDDPKPEKKAVKRRGLARLENSFTRVPLTIPGVGTVLGSQRPLVEHNAHGE